MSVQMNPVHTIGPYLIFLKPVAVSVPASSCRLTVAIGRASARRDSRYTH